MKDEALWTQLENIAAHCLNLIELSKENRRIAKEREQKLNELLKDYKL